MGVYPTADHQPVVLLGYGSAHLRREAAGGELSEHRGVVVGKGSSSYLVLGFDAYGSAGEVVIRCHLQSREQ